MRNRLLATLFATAILLGMIGGVAAAAPRQPAQPQAAHSVVRELPADAARYLRNLPGDVAIDFPIVWAFPPVFNDYLVCVNDYIYTDFVDWDGADENMDVHLWAYGPSMGLKYTAMDVSGPGPHGVFWYVNLSGAGINPAAVSTYFLRATDEDGLKSPFVVADGNCNLK